MAHTPEELRALVLIKVNADRLSWVEQNEVSYYRSLHIKHDYQLDDLEDMYRDKLLKLGDYYEERVNEVKDVIQNFDFTLVDFKGEIASFRDKVLRLADKWWAVKWEKEGRRLGHFDRTPAE